MKKNILTIILLTAGYLAANSQQKFNFDSLSVNRVVQVGLESNFDIRIRKQIVGESLGQLTQAKGAFNPQLSLSTYGFYGTDPTVTFKDSYYLSGQFLLPTRMGIKVYSGFKLSTETEIISGIPDVFPSTDMPVNASGVWAGLSMPLLRDLGKYNSRNIVFQSSWLLNNAQNVSFSDEICQFIKNTLIHYYDVYLLERKLQILSEADADAKEYLADIQDMITNEQLAKAEFYRAKSYEFNISQQFAVAKNQVENSLYNLYTLLGMEGRLSVTDPPVFLDSLPDPATFSMDGYMAYILENIDSLVNNTYYYKSQELEASAAQLEMDGAKHNNLNELDLDLRYMYFGSTAYQPFSDFSQTFSSGSPGSSVNIMLSYKLPFKNEERKGEYVAKLSSYEFEKAQLEKLKFDAKMQIYQILNDLDYLLPLFRNQVELAGFEQLTYDNESQKLKMGASTQINVINTYMDYNTALLNVESCRQTILTRIITLKYLTGDFPTGTDQLLQYNLWDFSIK